MRFCRLLLPLALFALTTAACGEAELAPSQHIHWPDGGMAWRIDCENGDCDREAKRICPHGHDLLGVDRVAKANVILHRYPVVASDENEVHEAIIVRCASQSAKWSPAPAAPRTARAPDVCGKAFEHVRDLANAWVEANPERRVQPDLPSRERFTSVCTSIPDEGQICLNASYLRAHKEACSEAFGRLPERDWRLVEGMFLQPQAASAQ